MTPTIRLLIVDDHPVVRSGIRAALAAPGFEVVGEAATAEDAAEQVRILTPDVVLMDINLPGMSGIEAVAVLKRSPHTARVLMLSVHVHPEFILESVRAGASGYLRKDSLPSELRDAIRAVHGGRTVFGASRDDAPAATTPVLAAAKRVDQLTRREREVLIGIASGKSNKEIAADLDLSVRTIESYRESLSSKLAVRSAASLTRIAIESRLLSG